MQAVQASIVEFDASLVVDRLDDRNRLNDHRNRGSAQCDNDQVGQNMVSVTLDLT